MTFAAEYLAQLEAFAAIGPLPRVRALHLPPEPSAEDNKGEFCALELDDGSLGLSYVLLDDTLAQLREGADSFGLAGADPLEVARGYLYNDGGHGIRKTLGFAAANALTRCLFDRAGYVPPEAGDSIGGIAPQPGDHIGMIGLFKPLLGRILASGARLTVVELKEELAGAADGYVVTLDADSLLDCTKVVATGTLLLNDTLDRMLESCRNARWFAMVGPSAGCLPDALFARGVTLLGGSWITDGPAFVETLKSGEKRSGCARKSAISRDGYPGTDALLQRLW
ncbi:Rossmann-like domain-containing protein [Sulfurisoma sediminicola]|uniref:Putative heavy-metal chelation protein n=1 Tax=Sulfurisoma sediminicola TaxID=1381557 RepID=A0A497XDZ0_9PROT|nr:DUF364 domain-containing protein [Sulfurisoma sediminicola]RLJ65190.1 putative heavy-metal chelation protein [Sulfurisoma sediminicola]